MFHSHTHRKGLSLHLDALRKKHPDCIAGTVTRRENYRVTLYPFGAVHNSRRDSTVFFFEAGKSAVKPHFSAQFPDSPSKSLYNTSKLVGPYVRLIDIPDGRICPELDKYVEYMSDPAEIVMYHGVELAVRECPGTTFTELNVRVGTKLPCSEEFFDIDGSLINVTAAFKNYRSQSCLCKLISADHSCRPESDYDGSLYSTGRVPLARILINNRFNYARIFDPASF